MKKDTKNVRPWQCMKKEKKTTKIIKKQPRPYCIQGTRSNERGGWMDGWMNG